MQSATRQFLSDVYDRRDMVVDDVRDHLVLPNMLLNMQSILKDPEVRKALVFRMVWQFVLRSHPSFETVAQYMRATPKQDDTFESIVNFARAVAPAFGLVATRSEHELASVRKAYVDASAYLSGDPTRVKHGLVQKFAHRFGRAEAPTQAELDQHLMTTYTAYWRDSIKTLNEITSPVHADSDIQTVVDYYEYSDAVADCINLNHRIGVDSFTGYQSDSFAVPKLGPTMMSLFEAASHAGALNGALFLQLLNAHCVYVAAGQPSAPLTNATLRVTDAINDREQAGGAATANLVVIGTAAVLDAVRDTAKARDLAYGMHFITLVHPCMVAYLPKIAASFASVFSCSSSDPRPPCLSPTLSLSPPQRSIACCVRSYQPILHGQHFDQVSACPPNQNPAFGRGAVDMYECTADNTLELYLAENDLAEFQLKRKLDEPPQIATYHDFIVRYCTRFRARMAAGQRVTTDAKRNAIVLVDNRPNFLNVVAARACLMNLRAGEWDVVVFCRKQDAAYYRKRLPSDATLVTDANVPPPKRFSMAFYNELLKSPSFWSRLVKYDRVLMAQDDGFLLRPGMEDEFLKYDYVGAPWSKSMPFNGYMEGWGLAPNYVGNGGLSLRNPAAMLEICAKHAVARKSLHFDSLQPEPEDVFFSRMCLKKNAAGVPSYELAQRFSSEELVLAGDTSYGFHKVFGYHSPAVATAFFDAAMDAAADAYAAHDACAALNASTGG